MNRILRPLLTLSWAAAGLTGLGAEPAAPSPAQSQPIQVNGVFPSLTVYAEGVGSRSEAGIGALIPWANKLRAVGYVAHVSGTGIGLYELNEDMTWRRHPASVTGTLAYRLVHWESNQAMIGLHIIEAQGKVRTFETLKTHRLAATARHLVHPEDMVYFLTMEGRLFEANVKTLETKELANLVKELKLPRGAQPHFKSAFTAQGRLVVANNTYEEPEFLGVRHAGRLAEWDGRKWHLVEENPFVEVSGKGNPQATTNFRTDSPRIGFGSRSTATAKPPRNSSIIE
jgi:hypothetical protein